jgi:hypothetical protein
MAFVFFGIGIAILFGAATGLVCALLRLHYQALVLLPLSAGLALGSVLSGICRIHRLGVLGRIGWDSRVATQGLL